MRKLSGSSKTQMEIVLGWSGLLVKNFGFERSMPS
jgi:hypothetical protein